MGYCCFIGPESLSLKGEEKVRSQLEKAIADLPLDNIDGFIYSRGAGFELLAFESFVRLKETYPLIDIILASKIPIHELNISKKYESRIRTIEEFANAFVDTIRNSGELYARLYTTIDKCDYCVVFYQKSYLCNLLVKHALRSRKEILLINEAARPHIESILSKGTYQ